MELITTLGTSVASKLAEMLFTGATEQLKKTLNKTDVEKAIAAGFQAADCWEKKQNLAQNGLFYRVKPDGLNGYSKFLERVFSDSGVQAELQKPLNDQGQPDVAFLVKVFEREGKDLSISLDSDCMKPWIQEFVKTYFETTSTYLSFQVAKENYLKQLENWFDDVKFAGISVPGQEVEKSEKLDLMAHKDLWDLKDSREKEDQEELRDLMDQEE